MARDEPSPTRAQKVCKSCKARKRKCNKAVPKCSSCLRRNLTCEYGRSESESDQGWHASPVDYYHDDQINTPQSIDYPTILFLDPEILSHGQVELSLGNNFTSVPPHILRLLGDMDQIHNSASQFFQHIHPWMPFISKKRFYELYLASPFHSRPEIVIVLLAIKLITSLPRTTSPLNPRTSLYHAVKHFYLEVESSSVVSILVFQAGVLIALYELGHGIYPATYLTIGACARYAHAIGINVGRDVNARKVLTLVEVEERRRVWWAIVILDRFVNIGCAGRPLVTESPGLNDLLPADDTAWDQGIVRPDESSTLSTPMASHMSKFALLCQAAMLLGQVLQHLSSDSVNDDDDVWMQLDRTLQSILAASLDVDSPDYDQITFIYSALVALHAPWLPSSATDNVRILDTNRSNRAREVIAQITERIETNFVEKQCFLGRDPEDISPWGIFFAYRICVHHMRSGVKYSSGIVKSLRDGFVTIGTRWNVAVVYLQLLEAQEAMNQA